MLTATARNALGKLGALAAILGLMWLLWALTFYSLEPQYGLLRAFDWATYTVTTNGEGTWVPTKDRTVLLAIVARLATWLTAFLFAALIVKRAIPDPTVFTHTEQQVLLGRAIRETCNETGCTEAEAVAQLVEIAERNRHLLVDA